MATITNEPKSRNPMAAALSHRDFRLLWMGQGTSYLGDQFHMIAAPWLVLQITHDPLALGTVMALSGIPRAVFMLLGGAVADRFSARTIMLVSDIVRLIAVALLAGLTLTNQVHLWMIYVIAIVIGIASGFFSPASSSIVPTLVTKEELGAGNSIFQGTAQLTQFLGPALAGGVIAWFAYRSGIAGAQADNTGMGIAFLVDALSFLVSVITLLMMSNREKAQSSGHENVFASIREGISFVWNDRFMRLFFILISFANFIFVGPVVVGMPVLSSTRLPGGAAAYGIIMSAYAGGNLIGLLAVGALPKMNADRMRLFLILLLAAFGLGLGSFGWITATWQAVAVLGLLGIGNGYLGITLITMIQRLTPISMLGRVMSLVLVANIGLAPLSQALSGALTRWSLTALFAIGGAAMLVLVFWSIFQPELKDIGPKLESVSVSPVPAD